MRLVVSLVLAVVVVPSMCAQDGALPGKPINLASSKQVTPGLPGSPFKTNSLPMTIAVSPDGRYAASLNAGYGTAESHYDQSILVVDLLTGKPVDFPDERTSHRSRETFYEGLAWGSDGRHLYASLASLSSPTGEVAGSTGNAIAVYRFDGGQITPERLLPVGLQRLAAGKHQTLEVPVQEGMAIPYPAGICVVRTAAGDGLLVANDLSDNVLLMDAADGRVVRQWDLSTSAAVPAAYPLTVLATRDGRRGFVALWNSSEVVELDLTGAGGKAGVAGRVTLLGPRVATEPGSHPASLALSPDERTLYVALANRDMVAAVDVRGQMRVQRYLDTKLPGQTFFGAVPDAVAVSTDGRQVFAANASADAVAVFDVRRVQKAGERERNKALRPIGFVPTGWYPTALATTGSALLISTAKGMGTGPNNMPQRGGPVNSPKDRTYIGTLLYGTFAQVPLAGMKARLGVDTEEVVRDNRMKAAAEQIAFAGGRNPIKHIIYIIKENRTYDQILGDEAAANGDPSLTMYGRAVTPNQHRLAEQFGILDNFYDSAEVSGDGHVWSNAAITSDYTEKTWQQSYRGRERAYDYEGVVSGGFPLLEGIPDVNEPASRYIWTNLAAHGKTLYHFGEYISTTFCTELKNVPKQQQSPTLGTPESQQTGCARPAIHPGEPIPANYGGGVSKYPWAIPMIAKNVATKPELLGHFDAQFPDFELAFPDQLRFEEFMTKFRGWEADKAAGRDTMPNFVQLRFANDHTAGTRPGMPRPAASIADNDLAVGRAVEAVSHSPFWDDTAFFILEDDAQDGADHVDAHRSISFVVSKYAPHGAAGKPFVDHRFYTTVSTVRTMERLMDLPPMNNNDAFAPMMGPLFSGPGDQPPYVADYSNRDNGLIYAANTAKSAGAEQSMKMNFRHPDQAPSAELNVVLWHDAMGTKPLPEQLAHPPKSRRKKDDDDD